MWLALYWLLHSVTIPIMRRALAIAMEPVPPELYFCNTSQKYTASTAFAPPVRDDLQANDHSTAARCRPC